MSHFTVLVIGDDVEKQLAPFHELVVSEICVDWWILEMIRFAIIQRAWRRSEMAWLEKQPK